MTESSICMALYSFDIGGSEVLGCGLIRRYLASGARVVCVSTRHGSGPLQQQLESLGVECLALGIEKHSRFARPLLKRKLAKWLRQNSVSTLHAQHFNVLADVFASAAAAGVERTIVTEHTAEPVLNDPAYRKVVRQLAPRVTGCTAINGTVQHAIMEVSGLTEDRVTIIENGVDVSRFAPSNVELPREPVTIGWVGRLHPDKDIANGLRAFAIAVGQAKSEMQLLIAGDGEQRAMAEELARELGIEQNVQFLGAVSDVTAVLRRCHFFLMSSRTEGTPLAMLEAMSCGLPLIATSVGGIPESVTRETAELVPAEDPVSLGGAIAGLADDQGRQSRMGQAARAIVVSRYSDSAMSKRYVNLVVGPGGDQ